MANFTGGKCNFPSTAQVWLSITTVGIFILVGLSLQLFIVAVNVIDWLKGRSLTATDKIITSIGITRIISPICSPFYYLTYNCTADLRVIFLVLNVFTGLASFLCSIWLSTLLSIFFCFKISTFHNVFFLRLKTIISHKVISLIFASVLLPFGYTVMYCLVVTHTLINNSGNYDLLLSNLDTQLIHFFNILGNIFPVTMFFASSVLLIISLGFHIRQMKTHRNITSGTNTYYKIVMFTAMSCLTCVLYSIVYISERYVRNVFGIVWMYVFWYVFPILHSLSLIYVTNKLRNQFFRIFHCRMVF